MNWKKFLLIGLAISGLAFAAAPRAEAQISVGIGFGFPVGYYGGYGCYPFRGYGYGGYGYGGYRTAATDTAGTIVPRRYYGHRRYYRSRPAAYVAPRYYSSNGRRVYYRDRTYR